MPKIPPIPPDQRSSPREGKPDIAGERQDRRDRTTGDQSGQPGDAGVNLKEQGRSGNLKQNVASTHWKTQDR